MNVNIDRKSTTQRIMFKKKKIKTQFYHNSNLCTLNPCKVNVAFVEVGRKHVPVLHKMQAGRDTIQCVYTPTITVTFTCILQVCSEHSHKWVVNIHTSRR